MPNYLEIAQTRRRAALEALSQIEANLFRQRRHERPRPIV